MLPCSRVYHIFRTLGGKPYKVPGNAVTHNKLRVVLGWMDEVNQPWALNQVSPWVEHRHDTITRLHGLFYNVDVPDFLCSRWWEMTEHMPLRMSGIFPQCARCKKNCIAKTFRGFSKMSIPRTPCQTVVALHALDSCISPRRISACAFIGGVPLLRTSWNVKLLAPRARRYAEFL